MIALDRTWSACYFLRVKLKLALLLSNVLLLRSAAVGS
jgi:hypothetical protein